MLSRLPIRARIALFGTAVVVLAVVIFGGMVDVLFERGVYTGQDQVLESRSQQIANAPDGRPGTLRVLDPFRRGAGQRVDVPVDLRTSGDSFTEFLDRSGAALFSTGEIDGRAPRVPAGVLRVARGGQALVTFGDAGLSVRVSVRPLSARALATPAGARGAAYVVVGQSAARVVAQVGELRAYLLLGGLLSIAGALVLSWVVAGRALQPLDHMTATVEAVGSAKDLRRRLPTAPSDDEVGRLTTAFNDMMGRLEEAYGRMEGALASQRRFVADASHELRTPLTTIRSNLGLLLGRGDVSQKDRREALQDMDGEAQRMSRLVQDLLTLARADAGQRLDMASVDVGELCAEVCRQGRRTYPGRHIEFDQPRPGTVEANADALRQLLWILLDNAARHSGPGGQVRVALASSVEGLTLSVADDGPGIPAEDRERVFERFYRADASRPSGGAGLGLSIARWVVAQHGGHIAVDANPGGGAVFTVSIPRGSPPRAGGGASERAVA